MDVMPALFFFKRMMVGFFLVSFVPLFLCHSVDQDLHLDEGKDITVGDSLVTKNEKAKIYISEGTLVYDEGGQLQAYELVTVKKAIKKSSPIMVKRKPNLNKGVVHKRHRTYKAVAVHEKYQNQSESQDILRNLGRTAIFSCPPSQNHHHPIALLNKEDDILECYDISFVIVDKPRAAFLSISRDSFSVRPPPSIDGVLKYS